MMYYIKVSHKFPNKIAQYWVNHIEQESRNNSIYWTGVGDIQLSCPTAFNSINFYAYSITNEAITFVSQIPCYNNITEYSVLSNVEEYLRTLRDTLTNLVGNFNANDINILDATKNDSYLDVKFHKRIIIDKIGEISVSAISLYELMELRKESNLLPIGADGNNPLFISDNAIELMIEAEGHMKKMEEKAVLPVSLVPEKFASKYGIKGGSFAVVDLPEVEQAISYTSILMGKAQEHILETLAKEGLKPTDVHLNKEGVLVGRKPGVFDFFRPKQASEEQENIEISATDVAKIKMIDATATIAKHIDFRNMTDKSEVAININSSIFLKEIDANIDDISVFMLGFSTEVLLHLFMLYREQEILKIKTKILEEILHIANSEKYSDKVFILSFYNKNNIKQLSKSYSPDFLKKNYTVFVDDPLMPVGGFPLPALCYLPGELGNYQGNATEQKIYFNPSIICHVDGFIKDLGTSIERIHRGYVFNSYVRGIEVEVAVIKRWLEMWRTYPSIGKSFSFPLILETERNAVFSDGGSEFPPETEKIVQAKVSNMMERIFRLPSGEPDTIDKLIYNARVLKKQELQKSLQKPASEQLKDLIGLENVKLLINDIVNKTIYEKEFRNLNNYKHSALHMCFMGNPGTAKTTVARLLTEILFENHVIEKPVFIEANRDILVGKYIGHTAPNIVEIFKRASGGVLFIDEAYSLDDGDGHKTFAHEAIATIIKEMEEHREDIIVIFAGYPEPMKLLLKSNPGFRSRIKFQVEFPDYSSEELFDIFNKDVKEEGMYLAEDAINELKNIIKTDAETARLKKNEDQQFGNGRYVRSLFENLCLVHARRIVKEKEEKKKELQGEEYLKWAETITKEDVALLEDCKYINVKEKEKNKIGFLVDSNS